MSTNEEHVQQRCDKVISKSDVKKLTFPSAIRGHVWGPTDPHGTVRLFRVVDRHGKQWEFRGRLRIDDQNGGSLKPEVAGPEWARFVREKELRPLDMVVFYLENQNGGGPLFRVGVRKRMSPMIEMFGINVQLPHYFDHYYMED